MKMSEGKRRRRKPLEDRLLRLLLLPIFGIELAALFAVLECYRLNHLRVRRRFLRTALRSPVAGALPPAMGSRGGG